MYSKKVLNLFSNPVNAGRIMKPDGIASLSNLEGTANVEFSLRIEDDVITNCNFRAQANPYIIAICSTITQMVIGKNIDDVMLEQTSVKNTLGEDSDIDITFCVECLDMAIEDYVEAREKAGKPKSTRGRKKKLVGPIDQQTLDSISKAVAVATEQQHNLNNEAEEIDDEDFGEDFVANQTGVEIEEKTTQQQTQPNVTKAFEGGIFNNPIFVNFFNGKHE